MCAAKVSPTGASLSVDEDHVDDEDKKDRNAGNHRIDATTSLLGFKFNFSRLRTHLKRRGLYFLRLFLHINHFLLVVNNFLKVVLHLSLCLIDLGKGAV